MTLEEALVEVERSENNEPIPGWFQETQYWVRLLAVAFTFASLIHLVVIYGDTSVLLDGVMRMNPNPFYYSSAFKFLLGVGVAVLALGFMSIHFVSVEVVALYVSYKNKQLSRKECYYLFLHDLIVMAVLIFASGAASSIGYVGMYGQPETSWNKFCNNTQGLCTSVGISVGFSYAAVLCFFALIVISSNVLMKPASLTKDHEPELV